MVKTHLQSELFFQLFDALLLVLQLVAEVFRFSCLSLGGLGAQLHWWHGLSSMERNSKVKTIVHMAKSMKAEIIVNGCLLFLCVNTCLMYVSSVCFVFD